MIYVLVFRVLAIPLLIYKIFNVSWIFKATDILLRKCCHYNIFLFLFYLNPLGRIQMSSHCFLAMILQCVHACMLSCFRLRRIFQAKILVVGCPFLLQGSSQARCWACVSCLGRWIPCHCSPWKTLIRVPSYYWSTGPCDTLKLGKGGAKRSQCENLSPTHNSKTLIFQNTILSYERTLWLSCNHL